ncbi:hypothetical protein GCM10023074_25860 [Microbispora amethystogenes]|uniref:Luciferase-like domain-containing protein n=1 Tax=Microbispora amethystogenes TaxID=1427754 RepID=A0ABQ4F8B7_9ACTN|nr:hypothetical protein Mam01_11930 [Microbispora amethystogenes]
MVRHRGRLAGHLTAGDDRGHLPDHPHPSAGEALNEHILGDQWPPAEERQRMLEEAVDVIRELWTGELVTYHGEAGQERNLRVRKPVETR